MKIGKAIENLTLISFTLKGTLGYEGLDAVKLGIEALSYIERSRVFGDYPVNKKLPGETLD